NERLAAARQKACHPLSETWGEVQSLAAALAGAPDPEDARRRLRSALRRIVEKIMLLVIPRRRDRVAVVQVFFNREKGHVGRDYQIWMGPDRATGRAKPSGWYRCYPWDRPPAEGVPLPGPADLDDAGENEPAKTELLFQALSDADLEFIFRHTPK